MTEEQIEQRFQEFEERILTLERKIKDIENDRALEYLTWGRSVDD